MSVSQSENYWFLSWFFVQCCHSNTNLINLLLNLKNIFTMSIFTPLFMFYPSMCMQIYTFQLNFHFSENLFFDTCIPIATGRLLGFVFFVTLSTAHIVLHFVNVFPTKYAFGKHLWCVYICCILEKMNYQTKLDQKKYPKKIPWDL